MKKYDGKDIDFTKQYSSIGEYIVEFEYIVNKIRFECSVIFQMRGLKNWTLSEIVFGQKQFTADPLLTCFESLCNELLKEQKEQKEKEKILQRISSFKCRFSKQIAIRNDLLHSTYLIGQNIVEITDKDKPNELVVIKNSPTKSGHRIKEIANSIDDIQKNINELKEINEEFTKITSDFAIFISKNNLLVGFTSTNRK